MDELNPKEKNFLVNKSVGALLFSVFGCMGFFFSVWKQNWNSAGWCLMLEISCVVLLVFNKSYLRSQLHLKYSASFFRVAKYVAIVLSICCAAACAAYITLGVVWQETFNVKSHYAAAPVALLTGFWTLILFFDFKKYETLLE